MIFQRLGNPRTEIHTCTIPTRAKNTAQSERNAASLSRRIVHLDLAEAEPFEVLALEARKIQKQKKIGGAEFAVECRWATYQSANAQVAFDQTRQFLKQSLLIGDRRVVMDAVKRTLGHGRHPKGVRRVVLTLQERKHRAHFGHLGGVETAATEEITNVVLANLFGDRLPHKRDQRPVAKVLARARAAELHQFALKFFDVAEIELLFRVKADMSARLFAAQQSVGADDLAAAQLADDQMLAIGIELVNVQAALVGGRQAFMQFQIEDIEAKPLGLLDLGRLAGNLDFEIRHSSEGNIWFGLWKLRGSKPHG